MGDATDGEVGAWQGAPPEARSSALLLDSDLFFVAKVRATLDHAGYTTRATRRVEELVGWLAEARPAVVLVNAAARGVDWRAGIAAARQAGVPVIAFAPHVELATQAAARAVGADQVISNAKLASDLAGIVARAVRPR